MTLIVIAQALELGRTSGAYGLMLGARLSLSGAGLLLTCWLVVVAWRGYFTLRQLVRGLDYLALSLPLFAVAVLISLAKSGALRGRARERKATQATE